MRAYDSGPQTYENLTQHPAADERPWWSPDGRRIAFVSDRDGDMEVHVMEADGSDVTQLTSNRALDWGPVWSPDGMEIAWTSKVTGNFELFVMASNGTNVRNLTNDPSQDQGPRWSPDGGSIAFLSLRSGNWDIYLMNADGSDVVNLTDSAADEAWCAWSPDGSKLAFSSGHLGNNRHDVGGVGGAQIYVAEMDGSYPFASRDLINISRDEYTNWYPSWTWDGRHILYSRVRSFTDIDIVMARADGSTHAPLITHEAFDDFAMWRPTPVDPSSAHPDVVASDPPPSGPLSSTPESEIHQPDELPTPPGPRLVHTQALLVGVSQYDHHSNLLNPTHDIEAIDTELREMYGVTTTMLIDPTREDFLTTLYALASREYADNEQLLVMFSGHGWFDNTLRRGYLALRDSKPLDDDPLRDSFVSHEDVRSVLERLDCRHVLLIVDSCFGGTLDPSIAMAPAARPIEDPYESVSRAEYIARKLRYKTRRYITAGGREFVPDGRPGQHSPFARQVLEALRTFGGADEVLTLEEILMHLEHVDPEPRSGELLGNEPGSSFVLLARAAPEPASKFASLVVSITPRDAEVRIIGGPPAAESLLKTLRVESTGSAERRYHLPLGTYRLRVSRAGYDTLEREITLTGSRYRTEVSLTRPSRP